MTGCPFALRLPAKPSRRIRARLATASEVLGDLEPGFRIVGVTKGQFSSVDLLAVMLKRTGPAAVSITTWTAGRADMDALYRLMTGGAVTSLRFLTDSSFPQRHPDYADRLRELFGPSAVSLIKTHAKWMTIRNASWDVVIRSSMNMNANKRLEQFDVDDSAELADFFDSVADEVAGLLPAGMDETSQRQDAALGALWQRAADVEGEDAHAWLWEDEETDEADDLDWLGDD